jgi:hypothetical protein
VGGVSRRQHGWLRWPRGAVRVRVGWRRGMWIAAQVWVRRRRGIVCAAEVHGWHGWHGWHALESCGLWVDLGGSAGEPPKKATQLTLASVY